MNTIKEMLSIIAPPSWFSIKEKYDNDIEEEEEEEKKFFCKKNFMILINIIGSIIAAYLSWKCNHLYIKNQFLIIFYMFFASLFNWFYVIMHLVLSYSTCSTLQNYQSLLYKLIVPNTIIDNYDFDSS